MITKDQPVALGNGTLRGELTLRESCAIREAVLPELDKLISTEKGKHES
jgi:hypothetical protein